MEDIYPQEIIKEYLEYNHLNSTLECFQAEIKSKTLIPFKKNDKKREEAIKLPRLYSFCMGEDARSANQIATEKRLEQLHKTYENLLKSAKKVFEVAIGSVKLLEENKLFEDSVSSYKLQLSKLQHELGIRAIHSDESPILSSAYVQGMRNKIINYIHGKEYKLLAQDLLKIRVECLTVPNHNRHQLIVNLEENDIFGGSLNLLLNTKIHSVCSATSAMISIMSSIESGRKYILGNNAVYICTLLIKQMEQEVMGSVCQRFIVSSLAKLSLQDSASICMIDSKVIEWIINHMVVHNNHPFIQLYSTALLVNLLNFSHGKAYITQNRDSFVSMLMHLLGFALLDHLELDVIYHCILASSIIVQVIPDVSIASQIGQIVEHVRHIENKPESDKSEIFDICSKILNKNHSLSHENKMKEHSKAITEEKIYFECFTDESPLI